eukprot:134648-Rhodomonas_salina.1
MKSRKGPVQFEPGMCCDRFDSTSYDHFVPGMSKNRLIAGGGAMRGTEIAHGIPRSSTKKAHGTTMRGTERAQGHCESTEIACGATRALRCGTRRMGS